MRKREDEGGRRERRRRRKRRNEGNWEGEIEDKERERGIREGGVKRGLRKGNRG